MFIGATVLLFLYASVAICYSYIKAALN